MAAPAGVTFLDHTADVGIDVRADSLAGLFHRAALGMLALLRGEEDEPAEPRDTRPAEPGTRPSSGSGEGIRVEVDADGPAPLLADWLRELLFLHEVEYRDYLEADFSRLDETGVRAAVRTEPSRPAIREIKGVTYHELAVARVGRGWTGRVIFDV